MNANKSKNVPDNETSENELDKLKSEIMKATNLMAPLSNEFIWGVNIYPTTEEQILDYLRESKKNSPAKIAYEKLLGYIYKFENKLDNEHEVGAWLVSFGSNTVFHIRGISYSDPSIICFDGINEKGDFLQLVQNVSQLNVLLVALKKLENKPKRIGFIQDK